MIVPDRVAAHGDKMTDEEIVAACVEIGLTESYAAVVLDTLRGRHDPDLPVP